MRNFVEHAAEFESVLKTDISLGPRKRSRGWLLIGLCSWVWVFASTKGCSEQVEKPPALFRSTIDVSEFVFEHEEERASVWRLEAMNANLYSFAYLTLDPSSRRRAVVLIDNYQRPTKALFVTGSKLLPVPEANGRPLTERIDRTLSDSAMLSNASSEQVITTEASAQKSYYSVRAKPSLEGYYEKFEDFPCLTLPDTLAIRRGGVATEFVLLLKNEKPKFDFDPKCGRYTMNLVPPVYSYVSAPKLRFAFTNKRLLVRHKNYVISIPYGINEEMIQKSPFLIGSSQLQRVLSEFNEFPNDVTTDPGSADEQVKREAFAVQRLIDDQLTSIVKAKR